MANVFYNFYSRIPRRIRILILFLIIILAVFFVIQFIPLKSRDIPKDFLTARQEASLIARDIVGLSDESAGKMKDISRLDEEQKYSDALILITQEIERNRQAREKAIQLSLRLEMMAKNLNQISPASAGQKALEAVSSETALISRLISYNDYLMQLLEVLRLKFLGKGDSNNIPELVQKINNEAQAINDLNKKFNETMNEFDAR